MKRKNQSRRTLRWHRWSRKSYAAFASVTLHREFTLGVLATSMCLVSLPAAAASADSVRTERLEAIVVAAPAGSVAARAVGDPVAAIDPEALRLSPLSSIEEALDRTPQIDVRSRGARGTQADLSIRGSSPDQAMILLNGVNFTDPRTGHQSHALPVPSGFFERVDFLANTQSMGAYAGALNFRTRMPSTDLLGFDASGGAYGTYSALLYGGLTRGQTSATVGVSYDRSDGYTDNTDYSRLNAYARAVHRSERIGTFDVQAGFQQSEFGANSFYSLAYPNQWEATQTALGSVVWQKAWGRFVLHALASYRMNTDRYELFRSDPPEWYKGANRHLTDNVGASVWATYDWRRAGTTSVGVDVQYNHIWSTVLGLPTDPIRIGGIDYSFAKDRTAVSPYVRHAVQLGRWALGASVSLASSSDYGTTPLWGASVGFSAAQGLKIEASVGATMRLPTFTDLYYTTATHVGNSDLRPERAETYALSLVYSRGEWSASARGYFRAGHDLVDWVRDAGSEDMRWHSRQITSLATYGIELQAGWRAGSDRSFVRSASAAYAYGSTDKQLPAGMLSKYALDYMKHKASASVGFALIPTLVWSFVGSYYDRNGAWEQAPGELVDYAPYFLLDTRLTWDACRYASLWVECSNVLDRKYYDFGGIELPGRWLMAGVRLRLSK